jgi:hypothetical protein
LPVDGQLLYPQNPPSTVHIKQPHGDHGPKDVYVFDILPWFPGVFNFEKGGRDDDMFSNSSYLFHIGWLNLH